MLYANNKGADQPAHPRSLISAFVVRCLDSIMPLVSISEISSLYQASVTAQAGLCLTWSQSPKTGFLVTRPIYYEPHHCKTSVMGILWKYRDPTVLESVRPGLKESVHMRYWKVQQQRIKWYSVLVCLNPVVSLSQKGQELAKKKKKKKYIYIYI